MENSGYTISVNLLLHYGDFQADLVRIGLRKQKNKMRPKLPHYYQLHHSERLTFF